MVWRAMVDLGEGVGGGRRKGVERRGRRGSGRKDEREWEEGREGVGGEMREWEEG